MHLLRPVVVHMPMIAALVSCPPLRYDGPT